MLTGRTILILHGGVEQSDLFDKISLYDIVHVPGIATDLNHIDTRAKVSGYLPEDDGLKKTLEGADVVVVTAGIARKPGMTRDGQDLLSFRSSAWFRRKWPELTVLDAPI